MSSEPEIGDRVQDAEAVVAAALVAFQAQEWEVVIALTDADGIGNLRREYLDEKAGRFDLPPLSSLQPGNSLLEGLDEMLASMPDRPITFHELAGVSTLEEAEALGTTEFMVRWAQARHDGYLKAHGGGVSGFDRERVVIGSVAILPDTVAVLVRSVNAVSPQPLGTIGMIAVLGDGRGDWRLDARHMWLGFADRIFRETI
jgi:hypothetical protein